MNKITKMIVALFALCIAVALVACKKGSADRAGKTVTAATVSLTVEVFDRGTDGGKTSPRDNEWTRWIQEQFLKDQGIALEFIPIPRWEETVAINNLMAAGTPPDICLTYTQELVAQYRDLGGLFDMGPYMDSSMLSDLKAFLGPDPALPGRDLIRRFEDPETKAVYTIPARRMNTANRNMFIRKDWLDKLGLPVPQTLEAFYEVLQAFKENAPGGPGQPIIPFGMGNNLAYEVLPMGYAFIDPALNLKDRWVNLVVDRHFLLPGYKEGVRFMNRMYNDGLIDPNFVLIKSEEERWNPVRAGAVGAFASDWDKIYRENDHIFSDLQKNVPEAELIAFDPITGPDGVTRKLKYDSAGVFIFIPKTAKNPEAALRYINWLARYENYHFLQIGREGINHDLIEGVPKLKIAQGPWIQNSPQNIDYTLTINGLDLGDPELTLRGLARGYPWPPTMIEKAYSIAMTNAMSDPIIPVSLSAAGAYTQTLIDKGNALLAQAITGKPADFDRVWEAGIQDWLDSGAQAIIDEREAKFPSSAVAPPVGLRP
ncbi:MAG: extracellular solute-binding protein [Spirochaetaceae bacterium]|jgi:putative aldouronate transport system substrate-binding protein|nr:extracellular solute-binding protein [Spirochaetaceae bacterium]